LLRLVITPEHQWLVAVHQGTVLSHTDCWMNAHAGDALQAGLEQRFSGLVVQTVVWSADNAMRAPLELDFLHATAGDAARCRRLRHGVSGATIVLALGAIVCLFGAGLMWISMGWRPQTGEVTVPVTQADTGALIPSVFVHDISDLAPLWQGLLQLPIDPDGWILQTAECALIVDAATCRADYLRRRVTTDNSVLSAHRPGIWRFKPVSLDRSSFESTARVAARRLPMPTAVAINAEHTWLTTLQQQSAITPSVSLGPWQEKKLGTDAFVVTLRSAEISLRLPVRQLSLLQSWSLPVFWQTVRLDVMPSATVDQHNSYLMLHLKGELRAFEPNAS
jgi:hypothetical protein